MMSQINSAILVIGASGFLGRHVAKALLAGGHTVRCMARDTSKVQDLADAGCEVVQGDILDATLVEHALESVQAAYICVHTLSPQGANSSDQDFMGVEMTGLQNIVRACETQGVRRLIYVTSIGISPDAPSAWLRGRWQTEQFLFNSGFDVTAIRPGMIVGRGGTGFEAVLSGAKRPVAIAMGSGKQKMRTVAVEDLAYYLVGVLHDPRSFGHHYDVGSDDVLTMDQMIDIAAECLGRRPPLKIHVPQTLLGLFAPLIERASKMPRGSFKGLVDSLPVDMNGDPMPIRTILGRSLHSYRQAVKRTLG
jgi:uncharacterized protein YbjT (DUF2867 family)